ncbi:hypothetical protein BUALT_Bualt18G0105200 [Buddleja alternifolia]|uniref:Uncharacterized protein n=1 Tax=Buddleja alternifolia TaxID=168488 RepID=A0AAV6W2T4_9LAMI|nr:hypothetical protein BUALT_Bualt18G0105200 [Buddleja alternifolia]
MGFIRHRNSSYSALQLFLLICLCFLQFSTSIDTISVNQSIRDNETLVSNGHKFKLGFFSPGNSSHRYVGIMFNLPVMTVIWVANRENPINDSSGIMEISGDGNLVIFNGQNNVVWSSNISSSPNSSAQILDTGNLVLYNSNGRIIWESFLHASDSFMEKMKIITDSIAKERNTLTSWRSPNDPSPGRFTSGIVPSQIPQSYIWKDGHPYWRSGPWNGQVFNGVQRNNSFYKYRLDFHSDDLGSGYLTFTLLNSVLLYSQLNASGILVEKAWSDKIRDWEVTWTSQESECDVYGKCGNFGVCYAADRPMCSCFPEFDPISDHEWDEGNWTRGCTRRRSLQCGRNITEGGNDKFLKMSRVKLPDNAKWLPKFETECRTKGAGHHGICSEVLDTLIKGTIAGGGGCDGSVLLDGSASRPSEQDEPPNLSLRAKAFKIIDDLRGRVHNKCSRVVSYADITALTARDAVFMDRMDKVRPPGLSFRTVGALSASYIVIKGLEEFMNEVKVVSKLQHRNLVRLLGCVESEEEMLA